MTDTESSPYRQVMNEDWDEEDCCYILRELELNAFSAIVTAYRAQGRLSQYKETLLDHIKTSLSIPDTKYASELRRVTNDPVLDRVSTKLNPSYNCSLEWLNAHATKEPPLIGDTFSLVPPPSQEFECEDQATSAVANELLSLAQKHNSMTQDEDACLAHLLQMHKEPYVPERARKFLLDSEMRRNDRIVPNETPIYAPPFNAAAVGSAPTKRAQRHESNYTRPGSSTQSQQVQPTDSAASPNPSLISPTSIPTYKRRGDTAGRGRRKRHLQDPRKSPQPSPSEDDIKRINALIANITKNPLASQEVSSSMFSSAPKSAPTPANTPIGCMPSNMPLTVGNAIAQMQRQSPVHTEAISSSQPSKSATSSASLLPKTSTGAIDSSPEAINEFIARISQQVAEEALLNNPVRRRRRAAGSSLGSSRSKERDSDCARARPFVFEPTHNGVKPPRGNPDKRWGSKVARRNPNGLAAHLMSQNHVTHIYQPPRGMQDLNGGGSGMGQGRCISESSDSAALASFSALQSGVPPLTPSHNGRTSPPPFFPDDNHSAMPSTAFGDKDLSHHYKYGTGIDENGPTLLKRPRMSMTTGEYLMQTGALQQSSSRFGIGGLGGTGQHVTPYNRYRTYANQSPSSGRIPVRVLPASASASYLSAKAPTSPPGSSSNLSSTPSDPPYPSRFTERRKPVVTNGRFTPPPLTTPRSVSATPTNQDQLPTDQPSTSTFDPSSIPSPTSNPRSLSTPPEEMKNFPRVVDEKLTNLPGTSKIEIDDLKKEDQVKGILSEAQYLLELASGGQGFSSVSASSASTSALTSPIPQSSSFSVTNGIDPASISLGGDEEKIKKKHLDPETSTALNGTAERGIEEESVEMGTNDVLHLKTAVPQEEALECQNNEKEKEETASDPSGSTSAAPDEANSLEDDVSEFFTSIPPILQQRRDSSNQMV
ncbi:hypothetical protein WR25_00587 [Diploscapter pachys]|uniref:ENT domain-containing protein n=1 Tax=Diploscapter pachys TaxID=2018661 RepID=A0A2A2JJW2_9BILA|nr:hypothetical protein WR25_00587 [Diploscapter pachys]